MSQVSYFQRFSQKENHATNNTLLVMRHFYQSSPQKIEAALSELVDDNLAVGLSFEQQIKSSASVPDALISQAPLEIFFETKRGGELDADQIERHISSISSSENSRARKVLFGLTRSVIRDDVANDLRQKAKSQNIIFVPITFAEIVRSLRGQCLPHETTLQDVLADYEDYLIIENLMQVGDVMTVVPCGISIEENVRFKLYFDPAERPVRVKSKFIGIYSKKCVRYLGQIDKIVTGHTKSGRFQITNAEKGKPCDQDIERIEGSIKTCTYFPDFAVEEHRFYLFDELHETEIKKVSKNGIWSARVFNLSDWLDYDDPTKSYSTKEAAERLSGKTFE